MAVQKMTIIETMVFRINCDLQVQGSAFRLHLTRDLDIPANYRLDKLKPEGQKIFRDLEQKFLVSLPRQQMISYLNGFEDMLNFNN